MLVFLSIVVALVVGCAMAAATALLDDEEGKVNWVLAITMGLIVGFINYFATKIDVALWLAPIFVGVMVGNYIFITDWWRHEGGTLKELLMFLTMVVVFFFPLKASATVLTLLFPESAFWTSVVAGFLPWAFPTVCLGIILASYSNVRELIREMEDEAEALEGADRQQDYDEGGDATEEEIYGALGIPYHYVGAGCDGPNEDNLEEEDSAGDNPEDDTSEEETNPPATEGQEET